MAQFKSYFNNKALSDVTIRYGDCTMPAHKLVLAQGSDYFKSCFEGRFSESHSSTLTLKDDPDSQAVFFLIRTLYGQQAYDVDALAANDDSDTAVARIVDLFIAADKYLVPSLSKQILADFPKMLQRLQTGTDYTEKLGVVIRHVYVNRLDAARELRSSIVKHIVKYVPDWTACEAVRRLMNEVPDLAFEIIVALAGPKRIAVTLGEAGTVAASIKRALPIEDDEDDEGGGSEYSVASDGHDEEEAYLASFHAARRNQASAWRHR
ncbi:hypothetical protein LTR86_004802 [Recurvomyces mirabilis]|nr:hypothetical protein LTR86_004802 [Recurvomyces mirabilis]